MRHLRSARDHHHREAMKRSPLPPRNPARRKKEWTRSYGSPERVMAVTLMGCAVSWCTGLSQNAHLETGGTGRKADADKVVNLCIRHHLWNDDSLHALGSAKAFDMVHDTDLYAIAEDIESLFPTKKDHE